MMLGRASLGGEIVPDVGGDHPYIAQPSLAWRVLEELQLPGGPLLFYGPGRAGHKTSVR